MEVGRFGCCMVRFYKRFKINGVGVIPSLLPGPYLPYSGYEWKRGRRTWCDNSKSFHSYPVCDIYGQGYSVPEAVLRIKETAKCENRP